MNEHSIATYDDEIDLRAIFETLWKARIVILVLGISAALMTYIISAWILPSRYQAIAYVVISRPAVQFVTESGLTFVSSLPDIKALPELVGTNAILRQVAADSRVAPLLAADEGKLADKTQVSVVGTTQLRFQVVDTDAKRAAILANVWAEKAAEWIDVNYGLGALAADLDAQITQSQQDYAEAQSALETYLATDSTPILSNRLIAQTEIFTCMEKQVIAANTLNQRLSGLKEMLVESDDIIPLSDALLLTSIRNDIDTLKTCGSADVIFQSPSTTSFTDISSKEGLAIIASLSESLQQRIANIEKEKSTLQSNILNLQTSLEQLNYQKAEFVRKRDQAALVYQQLTQQQVVIQTVIQQSGRVASVSATATTPQNAFSPRPIVAAAIAGMLGFLLTALGVLSLDWWKKSWNISLEDKA
jgi:capsular polysaccharide biosynthesis protein